MQLFLTKKLRDEKERKRSKYLDRGLGTLQDGYNQEDLANVNDWFLRSSAPNGLRNRLNFLMHHYMLLRSEDTRDAAIADQFLLEVGIGNSRLSKAWVMAMDHGKTNQYGRTEYAGAFRQKDPLVCVVGALALYFFWRFDVCGEDLPNFTDNEQLYVCPQTSFIADILTFLSFLLSNPIKLLKGGDRTKPMSYTTQNKAFKAAFKACNIATTKVTHAGRGSGVRMAESNGVGEAQLRRLGRWNANKMVGCYLTQLPIEAMLGMAGFSGGPGSYYISRSELSPPLELQQMVFPSVDASLEDVQHRLRQYVNSEHDESNKSFIAAQGVLKLLKELRMVLLQDSVFLMDAYPDHELWTNPIFHSTNFKTFSVQLKRAMQTSQNPTEFQLQEAMPALMDHFDAFSSQMNTQYNVLETVRPSKNLM